MWPIAGIGRFKILRKRRLGSKKIERIPVAGIRSIMVQQRYSRSAVV